MPDTGADGVQVSDKVRANVVAARGQVEAILENANGTTPEAHRRTAYGLWQSGLEYLQHHRRARTAYSRFGRAVLREEKVAENLHKLVLAITR